MKFNYSKLLGRIKECGYTQAQLADAIGINKSTLSQKLNNLSDFSGSEMIAISRELHIPITEIGEYFFAA